MWPARTLLLFSLLVVSFVSLTFTAPIQRISRTVDHFDAASQPRPDITSTNAVAALVASRDTSHRKSIKMPMGGRQSSLKKSQSKKVSKIGNPGPEDDLSDGGYDGEYDAQITFGHQTLDIQLDTGSALLMVYSQAFIDQYQVLKGDESVRATPYDASNATILRKFTCGGQVCSYAYGDGSDYQFDFVQDSVSLGGLTINNQPFAVAKKGSFSTPGEISGILGLGWTTSNVGNTRSDTNSTPLVEQMWRQNLLKDPLFSFSLLRNAEQKSVNWTSETKGGVFTLGELDQEQYDGDVRWKPLINIREGSEKPEMWTSAIDSLLVNGKLMRGSEEMTALFDTGTAGIALPTQLVQKVFASIAEAEAPLIYQDGSVSGPCPPMGSTPWPLNLTIAYGGQQFPVEFEDLVTSRMETEDGRLICNYVISATEGLPVLGASFLKNVFSAFRFDPPSIGLAKLSRAFLDEESDNPVSIKNTMTEGPAAIQTISGNWGTVKPVATPTIAPSAFEKGAPVRLSGSGLIQSTSLSLSLAPTAVLDYGSSGSSATSSIGSVQSRASPTPIIGSSSTAMSPTVDSSSHPACLAAAIRREEVSVSKLGYEHGVSYFM